MQILDINQSEIVPHQNFPNDVGVENIEIGASKNCFGKKYYPFCYLTDLSTIEGLPHFTEIVDYNFDNCHFLDYIGNFFELEIDRVFNNVIFCNPYGLGFRGQENSKLFLNKAGELLSTGGTMIVIGNSSNAWSNYDNANKWLSRLTEDGELDFTMQISNLETLDETHEYRVNHTFNRLTIGQPALPNQMFTISKIA
jgi:hypothetical protein